MEISDELIDKLAMLSRLHFDANGKAAIKNDLEKMVGFISKLNEINTSGVAPLVHISENTNIFRDDNCITDFSRDEALLNSGVENAAFFTVPKVIAK